MRNPIITARGTTALATVFLLILAILAILSGPAPRAGEPSKVTPAAPAVEAPFEAPSWEVIQTVKWTPRRVVGHLDALREWRAGLPPAISDQEALALKNTGAAENAKITTALGRLPASDEEVDWDATLTRSISGTPSFLNPVLVATSLDLAVTSVLFIGPFAFDRSLQPLANGAVAAEWSTSEDGLMDRVRLRDDLTWSDGAPYTARDIEFSFKVIMTPAVGAMESVTVQGLRGVKAYDDRTVVYFHRERLATNVWNINFQVIPQHLFGPTFGKDPTLKASDEHNRLNKAPVSSGPYRLVDWNQGGTIVCERRPEWFEKEGKRIRPKPYFRRIVFRILQDRSAALMAFKKGEIDEMEISSEQWHDLAGDGDFFRRGALVRGDEWNYAFLAWNQKPVPDAPFFKDAKVRRALSLAFPHREFLEKVCFGLYRPAPGIFHPDTWMADPSLKPLEQDLVQASKLLDEAGWADTDGDSILDKEIDGKRIPFRFEFLLAAGSGHARNAAALLKRELEKLGVVCDLKEGEAAVMGARLKEHKFQATALVWVPGVDPDTLRAVWTTGAYDTGRNYVGYSSPRVDALFEEGKRELDPARRVPIYREIERTIAADSAYTFLYFRNTFYAVSKDLRGVNFSPRGPYNFAPGIHSLWKRRAEAPPQGGK